MKNLIIGDTSQMSYYYPDDYIRISSRNINFDYLKSNYWDSVYITFAEQNVYNNLNNDFLNVNYFYTLKVIDEIINNSNRIVIFTTCELWNKYNGEINLNCKFDYSSSNINMYNYIYSKEKLYNDIIKKRKEDNRYNKIIIIHPFNFNSVYRRKDFLFGKIFDSIINKNKITIGDTNFNRDIIHTKYLVERTIKSNSDEIVGSGGVININNFIKKLYHYFDMDYNYYVSENYNDFNNKKNTYYSQQNLIYTYDMLFKDTVEDIKKYIEK